MYTSWEHVLEEKQAKYYTCRLQTYERKRLAERNRLFQNECLILIS
jgi:hypothetical protein